MRGARRTSTKHRSGSNRNTSPSRAIVCNPRLLLADEPVSALDMSTSIPVIDLLRGLRESSGLAVESGATSQILHEPREQCTRALVAAVRS